MSNQQCSPMKVEGSLIHDLEKAKCQAKWIATFEAFSSYAAIAATSFVMILLDLMLLFEQWAIKNHAEQLHQFGSLDQTIQLNQILGLTITFYIFRLVFSVFFAIPKYIFCQTDFIRKIKGLTKIS